MSELDVSNPRWTVELIEAFHIWLGDKKPPFSTERERITWYNDKKLEFLESRLGSPQQLLLG